MKLFQQIEPYGNKSCDEKNGEDLHDEIPTSLAIKG